jgi:hypothetical protein
MGSHAGGDPADWRYPTSRQARQAAELPSEAGLSVAHRVRSVRVGYTPAVRKPRLELHNAEQSLRRMWREQHGSLAVVLAVHTIAPMRAEAARDVRRIDPR